VTRTSDGPGAGARAAAGGRGGGGRLKTILANLSLVAISSLLGLAMIETALALFYPQGGEPKIHRFDPEVGYQLEPDIDLVHVWDGHDSVTRIQTNHLGLRGADLPLEKAPGEYRILMLGDSYTFGYGVADQDTFAQVLERRLREADVAGGRLRVINAGVIGYSTAQAMLQYELYGRRLDPDLVILNVFVGNDVQENLCQELGSDLPSRRAPCFAVQDGKLVQSSKPEPPPAGPTGGDGLIAHLRGWLMHTQLYTLAHDRGVALLTDHPPLVSLLQKAGVDLRPDYLPRVVEAWYLPQNAGRGWDLTRLLISRLNHDVADDGARFAVAIVPSRVQLIPEVYQTSKVLYRGDDVFVRFVEDPAKPQSMLRQFLQERGIPALDHLPSMIATGAGDGLYYPSAAHWNERGHQIAAANLEDFLVHEGLLPSIPLASVQERSIAPQGQ
jgi:hypothetical protein